MHIDAAASSSHLADIRPVRSALPLRSEPAAKPAVATEPTISSNAPQGPHVCGTGMQMPTMDDLMKAWGTDDPNCDLNGDGTVDVTDLLALINNWPGGQAPTTTTGIDPATPAVSDVDPASTAPPPAQTDPAAGAAPAATLRGIFENWGQNDPTHDLNGDGTVDVLDLLQFINNNSSNAANQAGISERSPAKLAQAERAFGARGARQSMAGVAKLTESLIDALAASGFRNQPPTNVHELVDKLNLEPRQSEFVLKRLQQQYPRGLGVNALG